MFRPQDKPRVFGCQPGADFPQALVHGLLSRLSDARPDELARVEIFVNTRRMQRRMHDLFDQGPARLLPRIRLITDLASEPGITDVPAPVSALRRRLELSQLISALLDRQPDLAPRAALFDLADSLALLLAEMNDEGVPLSSIQNLDVTDKSGHWQRSLMFLEIVDKFFGIQSGEPPDETARQRHVTEALIARWEAAPPDHPVLIAGSTGSRGATAMLMRAVAKLPQGALVLPGFDFELPTDSWQSLSDPQRGEDHPQYRFASLLSSLKIVAGEVENWTTSANEPPVERNRLISLALRPAPVTDQWMEEGPKFENVDVASQAMTLLEAPSPRSESIAISMIMRNAVESGKTVALVTPDRTLTRQVTAAMDRWGIEPDISVGDPLTLSAPGRLLLHVAELLGSQLSAESLLILLKHPMVSIGGQHRQDHTLWVRQLESWFRKSGPPFPTHTDLLGWGNSDKADSSRIAWVEWVIEQVFSLAEAPPSSVESLLDLHLKTTHGLVGGMNPEPGQPLYDKETGAEAQRLINELASEAKHAGILTPADYAALFRHVLARGEVRDPVRPHPNVMIWGTLEARVQGADLVILGGLNEGVWPELPKPDPWLNREMRLDAGLLLPERRIGLSAHDFQQAIAAKEVVLSRSLRDAESETIPSRWLNRLTNLMDGMSVAGNQALKEMRRRGNFWLSLAAKLEEPENDVPPAVRPSPKPPVEARPKSLSVTAITRLIRDPYAIYAQNVLRLRKLDPLRQSPDAPLRGTVLHEIFEKLIRDFRPPISRDDLLDVTDQILAGQAPWPTTRILWRARLERVADDFLVGEAARNEIGTAVALEAKGALWLSDLDFTLTAKVDRIDRTDAGTLFIYDYKTGSLPSTKKMKHFDKQLLLEAAIAEAGGFEDLPRAKVEAVAHIGLGANTKFSPVYLEPDQSKTTYAELLELLGHYAKRSKGYTSRRAMSETRFDGDYDHLARFGEWDETQPPTPEEVG